MDSDEEMGGVLQDEPTVLESSEMNGRLRNVDPSGRAPVGLATAVDNTEMLDGSESPPRVSNLSIPKPAKDVASDTDDSSSLEDSVDSRPLPSQFVGVVIPKPITQALPYSSHRSGLVYDARMRFHTEKDLEEDEEIHPEDPRRIYEIFKELENAGLLENENGEDDQKVIPYKLWRIPARFAEQAEVCLVHSTDLWEWMNTLDTQSDEWLVEKGKSLDSLYLHNLTLYCARLSAGGAIEACRSVVAGHVKNAIAVIRPPGHHAEHNKPGGFCFFDNVAIAARVCQKDFGDKCRKILILDWDVHHGNGVQQAFESDPNVLYISLHVYKDGKFYPSTTYGDHSHVGLGDGVGKNINIPWSSHGMHDGDYMHAFREVVMPCAQEFDPDLVIISAGFDAAEGDMLGGCHVSPGGFAHMTHMLMSLANGKVVACLEGGYNLRSIAKSALAVTRTLMGEYPERLNESVPSERGVDTVRLVMRTHSPYWKCLYPKDKAKSRLKEMGGERLHDILRRWQYREWCEQYGMAKLFIMNERISKSFDDQVLATPNWAEAVPLLVIFHDPPETLGEQNAHTGSFDAHNIIVTDVAKKYVEWAVQNDFAVIDVNVPKYITEPEDNRGYIEADAIDIRTAATRELATYLWDNYIEIYEATHIFLMGVGAAYTSLVWLLSNQESIQDRVTWIFNYVSENSLVPAVKPADDYFPDWYHKHSDVYVAADHACWAPERARRLRKKYGNLHRSDYNDINEMLMENKDTVCEALREKTRAWREDPKRVKREEIQGGAMMQASQNIYTYAQNSTTALHGPGMGMASAAMGMGIGMHAPPHHQQHQHYRSQTPVNHQGISASASTSASASGPGTGNVGSGSEIPVRGSPSASPNPAGLKSPVKMPPMGVFTITSPERLGMKRSPERIGGAGAGSGSPLVGGSPSRRAG